MTCFLRFFSMGTKRQEVNERGFCWDLLVFWGVIVKCFDVCCCGVLFVVGGIHLEMWCVRVTTNIPRGMLDAPGVAKTMLTVDGRGQ